MPKRENGQWICNRRVKTCPQCKHRYSKEEYPLWECPDCGKDRHCRQAVSYDGEACRVHGGASLKGAESPLFKHGGYSKFLPRDMASRYEEFASDPRKLSLEKEMFLIRAMVSDRAQALGEISSSEAWARLQKHYKVMMRAQAKGDKEKFAQQLLEMGNIIENGIGVESTRKEVRILVEQERRLVDTQRQLYIDVGEFITRGMVLMMFGIVMDSIKENVVDLEGGPRALNLIAEAVRRMVGGLDNRLSDNGSLEVVDGEYGVAER